MLVGDQSFQVAIPRLFCPACRVTAAVLPAFLPRRSPYPFCLRQAAIWAYLTESIGYRWIAVRLEISWQLPWAWVDSLASRAKETLALVQAILLHYEPSAEPIRLAPRQGRSRSVDKDERLAAAAALFVQAFKLWDTGYRQGRPWGRPSWTQLLAFVESCVSTLG